ncbi:NAD(P)-binding protein [Pleurotus eryngii]|uniref:NAD(P)-binding protein n=1 Tax=Pleurotus eryngii TaxID=5323 RepID=A0A9P5ZU72_PLEER|nr:NAD(P)-binding protein [Pleurotus eryngii]
MDSDVSPESPVEKQPVIGLIGMGAMGRMYAKVLAEAGWQRLVVCDIPGKFESLKEEYKDKKNIVVVRDGHAVARCSDFVVYSVEAEFIERVVAEYGPSTKVGAIVAGQTSVKAPEREAFEKHLPSDTYILSCHSLHGPSVSPLGQPLILIQHRAPDWALQLVENILRPLGSRYVYLSYEDHDSITANTQAVTHAAFLSMGSAWCSRTNYPWEEGLYVGGIETVKVNLTLRIYSNKWHVYAGLAILNPSARLQIDQYAKSATELFKLMLKGGEGARELRERVGWARATVFGNGDGRADGGAPLGKSTKSRRPILLSERLLDRFTMAPTPPSRPASLPNSSGTTKDNGVLVLPVHQKPNSHLSLLTMVDCWAHLNINPFHLLSLAATPIFRLFLGVAEHLFRNQALLDAALHSALNDTWHRDDDLEFVVAARGWSQCVSFGSFEVYRKRFEATRSFFEERFPEANARGGEMIKAIMESEAEREKDEESDSSSG